MKLVRGLGAVLVAVVASAPFAASAQVPTQMPIQGFLTDAGGTPINGATNITFSIYDVDTAGTPLFTETQSVMVDQGNFAAYLGDTAALDLTIFGNGSATFVGITVGTDPEMTPRLALGTVPYAALAEYAHHTRWDDLTGVPSAISGFDPSMLQHRVSGTCAPGSSISAIAMDGTVTCESDDVGAGGGGGDITGVTAGRGILGGAPMGDATISVDPAVVQNRVGGTCPPGSSINAIAMDGTVTCETDDLGPTYMRGAGLSLVGTTFAVDFATVQARVGGTCPPGQAIRSIDGAGAVICEVDDGAAYLAGTGLALAGTTFSIAPNGVTTTEIAAGAVNSTDILDSTIVGVDIATGAIASAQILDNSVASADILNGTIVGADVAADTLTAREIVPISGHAPTPATFDISVVLAGTDNYIFDASTAFTPATDAVCMVVVSANIESAAANTLAGSPFMRIGISRAGVQSFDLGRSPYFTPPAAGSLENAHQTRSNIINVTGGQLTNFGCYLGNPTGPWVGDTVHCQSTWFCL